MKTERTRRISSRARARQISAELDYLQRRLLETRLGSPPPLVRPRPPARGW